jgi:hypothetical protein
MNSLEASVVRVLFGSGIRKIRPIQIGANRITMSQYELLGNSIKRKNKPDIKYYPQMSSSGVYEPGPNTLWFKFPSTAGDLVKESVIVHEATHAILDMNSADIMIGDAEAIAYVAQCQYYIINNNDPEKRLMDEKGEGTLKDKVFELAMGIAGTLLSWGTPTQADYHELRQAVSNDPEYYWDFFTPAEYDGI